MSRSSRRSPRHAPVAFVVAPRARRLHLSLALTATFCLALISVFLVTSCYCSVAPASCFVSLFLFCFYIPVVAPLLTGRLCCFHDFIATMIDGIVFVLSVLCVIQKMSAKSTFRPPRNSRMRSERLSFGLKLPPRSSMITRQPPSHRHCPGPANARTMLHLTRSVLGANGSGEMSSAGGGTRRLVRPRSSCRSICYPQQACHHQPSGPAAASAEPASAGPATGSIPVGVRYERNVLHRVPARWVDIVDVHPDSDGFASPLNSPGVCRVPDSTL